jgi:23S rRNA (cytosine1962-C5)-methyltransferase
MSNYPRIVLKPGKEASLLRFHPWVFSGAIKTIEGKPEEGALVNVFDSRGQFLALGHYQVGSIAVRIVSFEQCIADEQFWKKKLSLALEFRKVAGLAGSETTNVFRLVHGEGDGLPGLIADYYNGLLVTQMHSVGMYRTREMLANAFREIMGDKLWAIYDKSEGTLPFKAPIEKQNGYVWQGRESSGPVIVQENKLKFRIDPVTGQKTGFFIDQRENRELLRQMAGGKRVLNMFAYTGGFSVYALAGDAQLVHTVDSSKPAIEMAHANVDLNFPGDPRYAGFASDAMNFMKDIRDRYDLIVLDPPAFAKHGDALRNALKGYQRLNAKALEQIAPGGLIFTFSCSQVVSREQFRLAVFSAAAQAKRQVRILHQLSQPADHPINIYHPEGEYLKGLVLYVE